MSRIIKTISRYNTRGDQVKKDDDNKVSYLYSVKQINKRTTT